MKNKSWIVGAILLVGCVAAFFSAVFVHKSETDPVFARKVGSPQPVMMAVAENGTLGKVIGANGVVRPIDVFDITPKVAMTPKLALYAMGEVKEILVDIGDVVSAGEELIRFDSQRAHFALNSANAQVNEARSRMSRLQNDLTAIASMYEQDMVARIELDDLSLQLDEAKTEYHLAAENRYLAQLNYENATIFAPVGAIVMERNISVGETPRTSDVLLTLGQIDSVLVETQLAEGNLQAVYIGQDATVTTLAVPGRTYEGTVVKINPVADSVTKTFVAYVKLHNPDLLLKPGLNSFVRLSLEKQALAVPSVALIKESETGRNVVFVEDENKQVHLKEVETGISATQLTEIRSGLAAGEKVVVVGQYHLKNGDVVRALD